MELLFIGHGSHPVLLLYIRRPQGEVACLVDMARPATTYIEAATIHLQTHFIVGAILSSNPSAQRPRPRTWRVRKGRTILVLAGGFLGSRSASLAEAHAGASAIFFDEFDARCF
jgi:hypothetical protein